MILITLANPSFTMNTLEKFYDSRSFIIASSDRHTLANFYNFVHYVYHTKNLSSVCSSYFLSFSLILIIYSTIPNFFSLYCSSPKALSFILSQFLNPIIFHFIIFISLSLPLLASLLSLFLLIFNWLTFLRFSTKIFLSFFTAFSLFSLFFLSNYSFF